MAKVFHVNANRVAVGVAVALVADVLIYLAGTAAGATWDAGLPTPIGLPIISFATVFPMSIGAVVVALVSKAKQSLVAIASWAVLIFSLAGAPGGYIASQDLPTGLALGSMHAVVGFVWFLAIRGKK